MFYVIGKQDFGLKILNSLRCGILSVDLQKEITAINDIAQRIFELENVNQLGRRVEEVFGHQPQLLQILNDAYQMKNLPTRAELELNTKEGNGRTVGYTISFIKQDDGSVEGISVFLKDLTLVEQMNEQEKLKDRLAALGQMAAGLAHEIRNPLAAIELTTSLIKRRLSEHPAHVAQLELIHSEVRKMNKIVSDCLEFVRPVKVCTDRVDLQALLEESLTNSLSTVHKGNVQIRKTYHATPPVSLDRGQMKQVLVNILINALQATDEHGILEIACGPSSYFQKNGFYANPGHAEKNLSLQVNLAPYAWVKISDNGHGISEDFLSKIFYPFFTTKEKGSGIGLAIAQKIIDSHRGSIDVESEVGKGTTFTIKIPL
jgi:PAS domain S-box-containing protein